MEDAGLLIAALVAIVAVVGLVILFSGAQQNTGAFGVHFGGGISIDAAQSQGQTGLCACPAGHTPKFVGGHGGLASCTCHKAPRAQPLY